MIALVLAAGLVAVLMPLLVRDLRRAQRRTEHSRIRLRIEDLWERNMWAFRAEERIAMSILRQHAHQKIVGPLS